MSLKQKLKNNLFKILDHLPEKPSYIIYHKIQDAFSGKNISVKIKSTRTSFNSLERILKKLGISLSGKKILEIGAGWVPIMPYFMVYFGKAKIVQTYDLREHYSRKNIQELNGTFASEFGVKISANPQNPYTLPEAVHYHPKTNLIYSEIGEVDMVFSRFVLEHVSPHDLNLMHEKFKNELKPGSFIVHFISPSDHRAYVDKNLSLQDFLQYSEQEWQQKQTKFDYHNRLRLPQYFSIFKSAGLEVVHLEYDCAKEGSEAFQKFKAIKLHEDFKSFSDEELTAGAINVVLKV